MEEGSEVGGAGREGGRVLCANDRVGGWVNGRRARDRGGTLWQTMAVTDGALQLEGLPNITMSLGTSRSFRIVSIILRFTPTIRSRVLLIGIM